MREQYETLFISYLRERQHIEKKIRDFDEEDKEKSIHKIEYLKEIRDDEIVITPFNVFIGSKIKESIDKEKIVLNINIEKGNLDILIKEKSKIVFKILYKKTKLNINIEIKEGITSNIEFNENSIGKGDINEAYITFLIENNANITITFKENIFPVTLLKKQTKVVLGDNSIININRTAQVKGALFNDMVLRLKGKNSHAYIKNNIISSHDGFVDSTSVSHHQSPNTFTSIKDNILSMDNSKIISKALIDVDDISKNSRGSIDQRGILFDNSHIDFFPGINIETPYAYLTHKANTLKIRDKELFYMNIRGIKKQEIKKLLTNILLQEG